MVNVPAGGELPFNPTRRNIAAATAAPPGSPAGPSEAPPDDLAAAVENILAAIQPGWTDADAQALRDLGVVERTDHCVASTGVLSAPEMACDCWPDGAHRCHRAPQHQRPGPDGATRRHGRHLADHVCNCGHVFTTAAGGVAGLESEWEHATAEGSARALVRVLLVMKQSQLPHYSLMARLVRDVARELKIDLVD